MGRAFTVLEARGCGKEGGRESGDAQPADTTPPPLPNFLALTSVLGTFLTGLSLLGALSPTSSSEVSVRESAWFVLGLKLGAGSSPGCGKESRAGVRGSLPPGRLLAPAPGCPACTWVLNGVQEAAGAGAELAVGPVQGQGVLVPDQGQVLHAEASQLL